MSKPPARSRAHRAIRETLRALRTMPELSDFLGSSGSVEVSHPLEIVTFEQLPAAQSQLRDSAVHRGWRYILHAEGKLALADVVTCPDGPAFRQLVVGAAADRMGRIIEAAGQVPGEGNLVALGGVG